MKNFLKVIIGIVLVLLILCLTIVVQTKDLVEKQLVVEAVKNALRDESNMSDSMDELSNLKGTDELIEELIKEYSNYAEDPSYQVGDKTADLIINYCIKNEQELIKITDGEFDLSEINKPEAREELKKGLEDGFSEINSEGEDFFNKAIYCYSVITSKYTIIKVEFVIAALFAILIALSYQENKWMNPVGVVGMCTGGFTLILYEVGNALAKEIEKNLDVSVNVKFLLIISCIELGLGLGLVILKSVMNKKKQNVDTELVEENKE